QRRGEGLPCDDCSNRRWGQARRTGGVMVVKQRQAREQVDPALWKRADMRGALAARGIAGGFKPLQRTGVSPRPIAALTGQSQSEISEILAGRQVVSYDLLARIADGLGVPRGSLGLAYDDSTAALLGLERSVPVMDERGQGPSAPADPTIDPMAWA